MDLKIVVENCFEKAIEECVKEIIAKHASTGIETDIKMIIKETARDILETDEEVQKLLKKAIIYWIRKA